MEEVEVFDSDEDNRNALPAKKAELEDFLNGAREAIEKEKPREEVRNKRVRLASKKKGGKSKPAKPVEAAELPAKYS